jgi:hypothetical protein
MKAVIKIVTAEKEFSESQMKILKRIMLVLIEYNLSVVLSIKKKEIQPKHVKLKIKSA